MCVFNQPRQPTVQQASPPPVENTKASAAEASKAAFNVEKQAKISKGSGATILTSPLGITDQAANTTKKKVLGA